jgi:hypothetical protein
VLDNWARGRRKAVWLVPSTDLYEDAARDFRDLGAAGVPVIKNLQALDAARSAPKEGVAVVTYATLAGTVALGAGGARRARVDQLVEWLQPAGAAAFEGALLLDEAHRLKNSGGAGEGGAGGTKAAAAAVELQRRLPAARVVYCSATGVSEVSDLAYATRLGLFGAGTAFSDCSAFVASLKKKGTSFLELLALELKGSGSYVARGLSFRSATFETLEIALTPAQIAQYDAAAAVWADLRASLTEALALCPGARDPWSAFFSAAQRFFKLLCVSAKVPAVVARARTALAEGRCVVIGLQSTGEAATAALGARPGDAVGWVSSAAATLRGFIAGSFPVARPAAPGDAPEAVDARSGEVPVPAAAALREAAFAAAAALELPGNALDALIDALGGPAAVAEMTGRRARVARRGGRGPPLLELRAEPAALDSLNVREREAFQAGRKLVAVISEAASTGVSLHAARGAANRRRRLHLTVEMAWSADRTIQQVRIEKCLKS